MGAVKRMESAEMTIQPGTLVSLRNAPEATYQVVNVDAYTDNVWVRRWPLRSDRSPTFAVPVEQVGPQWAGGVQR